MPNLWIVFTTGLVAGGISCMAVQGSLLIASLSSKTGQSPRSRFFGVLSFLAAKLLSYAVVGFLLGWVGSAWHLSPRVQAGAIAAASLFMIGTALSLLDVHPFFRIFVLSPPRFLSRYIRGAAKEGTWFAPFLVGLFTVFIPCGTTQAMMALAAATASPLWGMAVLTVFVLGTAPLFLLLGLSIDAIETTFRRWFSFVAAAGILVLAALNLTASLTLSGLMPPVVSAVRSVYCTISVCDRIETASEPTTTPVIEFTRSGYVTDTPVIARGETITLTLRNSTGGGCIQAFTIPSLGVQRLVPLGKTDTVTFTAPDKEEEIAFSCSMGMYSGVLSVR